VCVSRADIFEFKALPAYSEPAWVKAFVDAGKLPALRIVCQKSRWFIKPPICPKATAFTAM
jgi:peptide/nickel transport system substrate-binding protein